MSRRSRKKEEATLGGWKGAFADFCMSMMTLFMVMWIVTSADMEKREGLSLYFSDPGVFDSVSSRHMFDSISQGKVVNTTNGGNSVPDRPDPIHFDARGGDPFELELLEMARLHDNIKVTPIPGGLLIELMETDKNQMFRRGEYLLTPFFEDLLLELGPRLLMSGYEMAIIGHTDSTPYSGKGYFDNWSLSFARANSVREIMDFTGFPNRRIRQVTGMADTRPKDAVNRNAARNRRVELVLVDPSRVKEVNPMYGGAYESGRMARSLDAAHNSAARNQI
ncbi:OmpA/MotB family protein [Parendozoicomonas haliclonae]|uniref:Chemotaxis protein LafU n=1 Tax=Parendozoicomonas haliclonae TaxID=1960125 RepID=A0A1X7AIA8_9GAMM|nr:flagellar motor protein MotB [Parendozoicomonas haliclonae]SMA42855.1 Chemotaxis protein LafU [Parendozoicomonas haliclonae]